MFLLIIDGSLFSLQDPLFLSSYFGSETGLLIVCNGANPFPVKIKSQVGKYYSISRANFPKKRRGEVPATLATGFEGQ